MSTATASARRDEIVRERVAETGIDEAMIRRLVHHFYARVRDNEMLGPVFEAKVGDWDQHLAKLCDFWSSVALMTGRFAGKPMQAHAPLPIEARHFGRWLALFQVSAQEVCPGAAAAFFTERADTIAQSLMLGRGLGLEDAPARAGKAPSAAIAFPARS